MDILFLCHCVPNPPDKGEKIRAFHELNYLCADHRVHLVCFARTAAEVEQARELTGRCASVYVELLSPKLALGRAGFRFALGGSLAVSFYSSSAMHRHVQSLKYPISASVVYSAVMAPYAPEAVPMLLDFVDVDSEKWLQYGATRRLGFLYRLEGQRLRRLETEYARSAVRSFLTTRHEERVFRQFSPDARILPMGNGVDFDYFDPVQDGELPELAGRRFLAFLGAMDYYPNSDAVRWFATDVLPEIRRVDQAFEFLIVGRNPSRDVVKLGALPGVSVTGSVLDVRPYLRSAHAMVAPLRIARGVQNKVLEALAMGKSVLASPEVCTTLGDPLPPGILVCQNTADYVAAAMLGRGTAANARQIRASAQQRFTWKENLRVLSEELSRLAGSSARAVVYGANKQ